MMIEKLLMKITTKSRIEFRRLDMKQNRITTDEDNLGQPVFWQTPCCTHTLLFCRTVSTECFFSARNKRLLPVRWARQVVWAGWLCVSPRVPAQST
jgi:hypothetical protein